MHGKVQIGPEDAGRGEGKDGPEETEIEAAGANPATIQNDRGKRKQ
jgi:hypothetical protein